MNRALIAVATVTLVACSGPIASPDDASVSGDGGNPGQSDGGLPPSSSGATFPDPQGPNGTRAQIATDPSGTVHVLYTGLTDSGAVVPVRYGQCKGSCTSAASWSFRTLGEAGLFGGNARMAVSPAGAVHAVWTYAESVSSGTALRYAACPGDCGKAASWKTRDIATAESVVPLEPPPGRPLVLDSQGRPQLVFNNAGTGLAYATCASDCATTGAWIYVQLTSVGALGAVLALHQDAPQLLYASTQANALVYRTCTSICGEDPDAWSADQAFFDGSVPMDLALDAAGHPRVVFNRGGAGGNDDYMPIYAQCDGSCTTGASWSAVILGEAHDGKEGLALSLRPQDGRPVVAIPTQDSVLTLVGCDSGCSNLPTALWSTSVVDDPEKIQAQTPALLPVCSGTLQPKAFWYPGDNVSLVAGDARASLAYDAFILQQCGMGSVDEGLRIIRFASVAFP